MWRNTIFSCLFRLLLLLHKLLKVSFEDQFFYLFFSAWHSSVLCPLSWWKRPDLLRFFMFESLFVKDGYCMKYFLFIGVNTLAPVVVRGLVRSWWNVRWSRICSLIFFFDALVRDWYCCGNFAIWKQGCLDPMIFIFCARIWFFIICFTVMQQLYLRWFGLYLAFLANCINNLPSLACPT